MRIMSGLSSHSTPLRIGRLSSVDTANDVCEISFWRSPDRMRQLSLKRTFGNAGNSSRGSPRILKCVRPQSSVTRCSPVASNAHGRRRQLARDLAELLRRNRDGTRRLDVGRDLGASPRYRDRCRTAECPCSVASTRMFASTGSVVFAGMLAVDRGKTFLQFFTGDRKPHHVSSWLCKTTRAVLGSFYIKQLTSSSSRAVEAWKTRWNLHRLQLVRL